MRRAGRRRPALVSVLLLWPMTAAAQTAPNPAPPGQEPSDQPVSPQEIEDLRRRIDEATRSSLELFFGAHDETGDLNNRLEFLRYGARLNIRRPSGTTFSLTAQHTPYQTRGAVLESSATGLALGARWKTAERLEWGVELSGARFGEDWSVTGRASLTVRPGEALRYSLELSRTNVEESLLSVAGLKPVLGPFARERVGAVHDNRLVARASHRLPARFDVSGEAGVGFRSGSNVDQNFFERAAFTLGWAAIARAERKALSFLRLSATLDYLGFGDDRLGYGGASLLDADGRPNPPERLGSDGISPVPSPGNPGVGGYFSPERFVSGVGRVDARGRASTRLGYTVSAFLGTQSFTGTERSRAAGVSAGLRLRLGERLTFPIAYTWDDFGPFAQQSLSVGLVLLF